MDMNMYSPQPQTHDIRANARWASGVNVIAGAWLFISSWVLGYANDGWALANALLAGAVIVVLAAIRMTGANQSVVLGWLALVAGGWTFFSSWILGFGDRADAVWNNVIVGVVVVMMALISASASALDGRVHRGTPYDA
jgi:SPW repeat